MSPLEILRSARELISHPARWTTKFYARDSRGCTVDPNSEAACQWCALGAVDKFTLVDDEYDGEAISLLRRICNEKHGKLLTSVNDQLGHEAILECFDEAIKTLTESETAPLEAS